MSTPTYDELVEYLDDLAKEPVTPAMPRARAPQETQEGSEANWYDGDDEKPPVRAEVPYSPEGQVSYDDLVQDLDALKEETIKAAPTFTPQEDLLRKRQPWSDQERQEVLSPTSKEVEDK